MFGRSNRRATRQYPPYYYGQPTYGTYQYSQWGTYGPYANPWQYNYGYNPYHGYTGHPQQYYYPEQPQAPTQQPGRRPPHHAGQQYLYPRGSTNVHVIRDRNVGSLSRSRFHFKGYQVPPNTTLKEACWSLGLPETMNATEVVEQGHQWRPIATVNCGSKDAEKTMQALGWSRKPNEEPPLWLCFHQ